MTAPTHRLRNPHFHAFFYGNRNNPLPDWVKNFKGSQSEFGGADIVGFGMVGELLIPHPDGHIQCHMGNWLVWDRATNTLDIFTPLQFDLMFEPIPEVDPQPGQNVPDPTSTNFPPQPLAPNTGDVPPSFMQDTSGQSSTVQEQAKAIDEGSSMSRQVGEGYRAE